MWTASESQYGMHVVVMWECEWVLMTNTDPAVKSFLLLYKNPEHLDPREALFGGSKNAMKLHHKVDCDNDEKINYFDFTSLYPTVVKKRLPNWSPGDHF